MDINRRQWLALSAAGGLSVALSRHASAETARWERSYSGLDINADNRPGEPGRDYLPTITPNGTTLPFKVVAGVKVFHLIAEPVLHKFAPGLEAECWGYNGRVHGPTIEAVEGDRVRVYVTNRLPAATTVHWHGIFLPNGMDGVGGLNQKAIPPGQTYVYEWTFSQHGTYMYHSHHDEMTQMAMGMMGMIVVHPRQPAADDKVDRDFTLMLSEWSLEPGARRPDPNAMADFNVLTMNAKCFPGTDSLVVKTGQRVRIRFGNLSAMDHHPIHLHGHYFKVTATDGGLIPAAGQWPQTTVLVPTGSTRTVEFIADAPGDWAMHCHMTHHVMTQMGHDITNMVGADPERLRRAVEKVYPRLMVMGTDGMGEHGQHVERGHMPVPENSTPMVGQQGPYDYITMGGMFNLLKVRDHLSSYADPGWYQIPAGTQSVRASKEAMQRDGIGVP